MHRDKRNTLTVGYETHLLDQVSIAIHNPSIPILVLKRTRSLELFVLTIGRPVTLYFCISLKQISSSESFVWESGYIDCTLCFCFTKKNHSYESFAHESVYTEGTKKNHKNHLLGNWTMLVALHCFPINRIRNRTLLVELYVF